LTIDLKESKDCACYTNTALPEFTSQQGDEFIILSMSTVKTNTKAKLQYSL